MHGAGGNSMELAIATAYCFVTAIGCIAKGQQLLVNCRGCCGNGQHLSIWRTDMGVAPDEFHMHGHHNMRQLVVQWRQGHYHGYQAQEA